MKDRKTSIRAFVRPGKRHSEARQIASVIDAGATSVYVEGKARPSRIINGATVIWLPDARETWLRSIRSGDDVLIATAGRIGPTRCEIARTLTDIHERGAVLIEASSGRRSNDPAAAPFLMLDAVNELTADRGARFTSETGRAASAKASRPSPDRMGITAARQIWRDTAGHPTTTTALDAMPGWTIRAAYIHFGKRHGGDKSRGGRPRKT